MLSLLEGVGVGAGWDDHRSVSVPSLHSFVVHNVLGEVFSTERKISTFSLGLTQRSVHKDL